MGSNRYKGTSPRGTIPDYTPRESKKAEASAKQLEPTIALKPCCVCNGVITTGYFGRWEEGGTCTKKCETVRQDMQQYLK